MSDQGNSNNFNRSVPPGERPRIGNPIPPQQLQEPWVAPELPPESYYQPNMPGMPQPNIQQAALPGNMQYAYPMAFGYYPVPGANGVYGYYEYPAAWNPGHLGFGQFEQPLQPGQNPPNGAAHAGMPQPQQFMANNFQPLPMAEIGWNVPAIGVMPVPYFAEPNLMQVQVQQQFSPPPPSAAGSAAQPVQGASPVRGPGIPLELEQQVQTPPEVQEPVSNSGNSADENGGYQSGRIPPPPPPPMGPATYASVVRTAYAVKMARVTMLTQIRQGTRLKKVNGNAETRKPKAESSQSLSSGNEPRVTDLNFNSNADLQEALKRALSERYRAINGEDTEDAADDAVNEGDADRGRDKDDDEWVD